MIYKFIFVILLIIALSVTYKNTCKYRIAWMSSNRFKGNGEYIFNTQTDANDWVVLMDNKYMFIQHRIERNPFTFCVKKSP